MSNGSRLCSCQGRPLRPGYDQLSCLRHRGKRRPKKWPKSGHLVDNNTVAEFWKKARVKAITRPFSPAQCCLGTWLEKSKQEGYSWRFAKAKQKAIIITIKGSFLFSQLFKKRVETRVVWNKIMWSSRNKMLLDADGDGEDDVAFLSG